MDVLIVVRWPVGGIRTYLKYVYKGILERGYNCTFAIVDEAETKILRDDLTSLGANWVVLPSGQSHFFYVKRIYQEIKNSNFDIVHAHGFTSAAIAILPAKLTSTPVIMTSHDVLLADQFRGVKGQLKKLGLASLFNQCSVIQSVSHDAKDNLHEMLPLLNSKRSIVIENGIDEEKFLNCKPIDLHTQLGVSDDTLVIGFFGRFMGQKGFTYIVDAVRSLVNDPNYNKPFVVITVGQGGFFREEVAEIKRLGLEDCFKHLPYISNIAETIKSTDLVLMPSLWEACGLLAMEAMVAGTPIITTDCIGLREVTRGTPAIKVPLRDGLSIANAIKNLNDETIVQFQSFVVAASEKYSIKNTIEQVDQLYIQFK